MSGEDTIEKVKQRQGILSKIENLFGFGYETNITIRLIALLWTPHWLDEEHKTAPAWQ